MLKAGFSYLGFALLGVAATSLSKAAGAAAAASPAAGAAFVAANALGSVSNRLADSFGTKFVRRTAERHFIHWGRIDENNVVIRELRRAQLRALWKVFQQFEKARETDPDVQRQARSDMFCIHLRKFLDEETGAVDSLTWAGVEGTAEQENALRRRVLEILPQGFDESLGERNYTGLKIAAEAVVLEELRQSVFQEIPSLFYAALEGGQSGGDGWFDLFTRDAVARLKAGGDFERIWNAEQTAAVKDIAQEIQIGVDSIADWLPQANAALRALGAGLDAMAGDLEAAQLYAKAVYDRACGDDALPLDFDEQVPPSGVLRFSTLNPRVPFVGRQPELAALESFLTVERRQPFSWWLVIGGGGAGKTRLARQLCLRAHLLGWRAGFLPKDYKSDLVALHNWRPRYPTLIVADYVLKRNEDIRRLAARLARRSDPPQVRLLLLEREGGRFFEDEFLGPDQTDRGVLEGARNQASPLTVPSLPEDDLWMLVQSCPWRADGKSVEVSRGDFFSRLAKLDRQRRALVAMILADAYAADPNRTSLGSLDAELRDLLRRERALHWPVELGAAGRPIGAVEADAVITLATIVGGLGLPELKAMEAARGEPVDRGMLLPCARAVGKPIARPPPELAPLEPDLIGEFFALETLGGDPDNAFVDPPHGWMPELAWRLRPGATRDFVLRAMQNFPHHRSMDRMAIAVKKIAESWVVAAAKASTAPGMAPQISDAGIKLLRENAQSDSGAAMALTGIVIMHAHLPGSVDFARLVGEVRKLEQILTAHPDEPQLRSLWAKGVQIVLPRAAPTNPAGCIHLLNSLAVLYVAHPSEPELRERWAASAQRFILHVKAARGACRGLLDRLGALQRTHPEEPALREEWAKSVATYINHFHREDSDACRNLLEQLAALHSANSGEAQLREKWAWGVESYLRSGKNPDDYQILCRLTALRDANPDEPPLRETWSSSVANFISNHAKTQPDLCRTLIERLSAAYAAYPAEPALRESWARAAKWIVAYRSKEDPVPCGALLDDLTALQIRFPDEPRLREIWAQAAQWFIAYRSGEDPVQCRALLDKLDALHLRRPNEPKLRSEWADGVAAFIRHQGEREPVVCNVMLSNLAALQHNHPDEPALRESWAQAARWIVWSRSPKDRAQCCALLDKMDALHLSHPNEPRLRHEWASGVSAFIIRGTREDPEHHRVFLNSLNALLHKYPEEHQLRTEWAAGAAGFILRHADDEPNGCMAILSNLNALRRRHPSEPAVREWWGRGVRSFISLRAGESPSSCRALLDELAVASDAHPDEPALREARAAGTEYFVRHCAARDPEGCRALLSDLAELQFAYSGEPPLRLHWAEGVRHFFAHRAVHDATGCAVLLDILSGLHARYPGESRLRELQAECAQMLDGRGAG